MCPFPLVLSAAGFVIDFYRFPCLFSAVPSYGPSLDSSEKSEKLFAQNSDQEGYLHVFPQWAPRLQALVFDLFI